MYFFFTLESYLEVNKKCLLLTQNYKIDLLIKITFLNKKNIFLDPFFIKFYELLMYIYDFRYQNDSILKYLNIQLGCMYINVKCKKIIKLN